MSFSLPAGNSHGWQILFFILLFYAALLYYFLIFSPRGRREQWIGVGLALSAVTMLSAWIVPHMLIPSWYLSIAQWQNASRTFASYCTDYPQTLGAKIQATTERLYSIANTLQVVALALLIGTLFIVLYLPKPSPK